MAISHLSRRLLSPAAETARLLPKPHPLLFLHPHRHFSAPSQPDGGGGPAPVYPESMKHQEIEGPTVERDTSPLADETRRELDALRAAVQRISGSLALLGGRTSPRRVDRIGRGARRRGVGRGRAGVVAFAFPFTAALVLRRAIKPIAFFQKMEANGRLQVLTLCLQATKNVNLMLLRTRVVAISCALGVSVGSVATILMR